MLWIATMTVVAVALYLKRARAIYRRLRAAIRDSYGPKTVQQKRRAALLRALCWAVPARLYHWREIAWRRQQAALYEESLKDDSSQS